MFSPRETKPQPTPRSEPTVDDGSQPTHTPHSRREKEDDAPTAPPPHAANEDARHDRNAACAQKDDGAGDGLEGGSLHATEEVRGFVSPHIPITVIVLLLFTAMAQSFSATIISLFINIDMELGPVEVTRYWMYVGYTIWFQPVIGWISDVFVVFGEKRRPLFILALIGNTVIYFVYCFKPSSTASFTLFVFISIVSEACVMGLYIPLNGLIVEVGRKDSETQEESVARMSAIMSKAMVFRSIGSLAGTVLQTCLVLRLTVRNLLGFTAGLYCLLLPLVLITPRKLFLRPAAQDPNIYRRLKMTFKSVKASFNIRDYRSDGFCFVLVLVFVFVYTMMPDASSVYYNYLYGEFMFETWFYSMNNCIGYLGSIVGAYLFSLWMQYRAKHEARGGVRTSMFFIFVVGSLAWVFGYVTNLLLCTGFITNTLGISAEVYIPIDNFFMSMFVRFAFMPTIAMAAEHAPKNFEATAFEVFSVASTGGGTVSSLITSFIAEDLRITRTDYSSLWILIVISVGCKLVPIPLAWILPEHRAMNDVERASMEGEDEEIEAAGEGVKKETEFEPVGGLERAEGTEAVMCELCNTPNSFVDAEEKGRWKGLREGNQ